MPTRRGNKNQVSIRMDPELYEALNEVAKREERTFNQQVVYYVKRGLELDKFSPDPCLTDRERKTG